MIGSGLPLPSSDCKYRRPKRFIRFPGLLSSWSITCRRLLLYGDVPLHTRLYCRALGHPCNQLCAQRWGPTGRCGCRHIWEGEVSCWYTMHGDLHFPWLGEALCSRPNLSLSKMIARLLPQIILHKIYFLT